MTHIDIGVLFFFLLCVRSPHLARVVLLVLLHTGCKNCCTDPGLSNVVAQFRHAKDARLHQTPARKRQGGG